LLEGIEAKKLDDSDRTAVETLVKTRPGGGDKKFGNGFGGYKGGESTVEILDAKFAFILKHFPTECAEFKVSTMQGLILAINFQEEPLKSASLFALEKLIQLSR
jgi:hypothetical protein